MSRHHVTSPYITSPLANPTGTPVRPGPGRLPPSGTGRRAYKRISRGRSLWTRRIERRTAQPQPLFRRCFMRVLRRWAGSIWQGPRALVGQRPGQGSAPASCVRARGPTSSGWADTAAAVRAGWPAGRAARRGFQVADSEDAPPLLLLPHGGWSGLLQQKGPSRLCPDWGDGRAMKMDSDGWRDG